MSERNRNLYIFLDEGGNLDFADSGTKYFTLTGLSKERPFEAFKELHNLKYDCIESGAEIECFHASEDRQKVRDQVFAVIDSHLTKIRLDSLIVEKRKTGNALQIEERFYPEMMGYLVDYIIKGHNLDNIANIYVFTDSLSFKKKREAVEKAIKKVLSHKIPKEILYHIFHHASKSNYDLQIVDYCNWAIFRKWERNDDRSYNIIKKAVASEFEIFRNGSKHYY